MARRGGQPGAGRFASDEARARLLEQVRLGRIDCTGEVTLAAGATSTVVADPAFGANTVLLLRPTTAAGAALKTWQSAVGKGSVTVGHDAPGAPAPFLWVARG